MIPCCNVALARSPLVCGFSKAFSEHDEGLVFFIRTAMLSVYCFVRCVRRGVTVIFCRTGARRRPALLCTYVTLVRCQE